MLSNLNIRVQNFKSYLDSDWVNLDGKNVLVGIDTKGYSNGSGKSSILDALTLFLDNNWEHYNKTEVSTLTNVNTPKKQSIVISLKCLLDGEVFEAQINGSDGFIFSGDKSKLAKFQQELVGSVMTQGLINNLADFEKRSQLDDYIDQFYKVKEIIAKLKDFQKDTVSNLGKKIDSLNTSISVENSALNKENQNYFTCQGQITLYQQYSEESITKLEEEFNQVNNTVNSLYDDFNSKRNKLQNEKFNVSSRIAELSSTENIKQKINKIKQDKDNFISSERTKYLAGISRQLNSIISSYVQNIGYIYGMKYNQEVEKKRKDRLNKIAEIEDKISKLSLKTPDYVLTKEEVDHVNLAVSDWVPQEFKLGDTYGEVTKALNSFVVNVKKAVEEDSQEVIKLREELQKVPNLTYNKSAIQKRAEELSIASDMKKYAPVNKPVYYVYWEFIEELGKFEFDYNLPTEFEKTIDIVAFFNTLPKFSYDTSIYDLEISSLEKELEIDSVTELNNLNLRVKQIDEELSNLTSKELEYSKYAGYKTELTSKINGCRNYLNLSTEIMKSSSNIIALKENIEKLENEKSVFVKRQEDMNKLADSISKFSGEELRNEFGYKLAKLSSVLLNDIFNLDGEIMLESNGLRTTFKYNDGNGFLSFKVLSGGQLQKIKISINLALLLFFYKDRQYIFLDEVFQHLDNPSKGLLINYIVKELGIKNILLIQHDSLKFEGFKEIRVFRDENKNTKVVK
jgi:DNA repair exonuclease SbcCD ATPase subunit